MRMYVFVILFWFVDFKGALSGKNKKRIRDPIGSLKIYVKKPYQYSLLNLVNC